MEAISGILGQIAIVAYAEATRPIGHSDLMCIALVLVVWVMPPNVDTSKLHQTVYYGSVLFTVIASLAYKTLDVLFFSGLSLVIPRYGRSIEEMFLLVSCCRFYLFAKRDSYYASDPADIVVFLFFMCTAMLIAVSSYRKRAPTVSCNRSRKGP